jgi:UDP-GlcNAc:undecaprenyl-phosphate GlcNAc-1-phosphate transferase
MRRRNYRGRRVLFPAGVLLLATGAFALTAGLDRWFVFLCGVGYLGLVDDLAGGPARGLRGHGRAVARGELSTGALKAAGTVGLAAYAVAATDASAALYVADVLVLALSAHLGNLLDTRPGRPEKGLALEPVAVLLPAVALCAWLTLSERAMLGDTGASLIGGMIGVLAVTALSPLGVALSLAGLIAISLYGEFRSLSEAIDRVPLLHRLDSLGRVN